MWVLGMFSAAESFFFPLPVEPLIMAICIAKPKKSISIALIASFWSCMGAGLGYLIGFWFWSTFSGFFFEYIVAEKNFDLVMNQFRNNVFWGMFIGGFTPIPFKIFTLAGGVAQVALLPFFLGALTSRTLRFGLVGLLFFFFGAQIKKYIDQYFQKIAMAAGILVIALIVFLKFFPLTKESFCQKDLFSGLNPR